jgi:hypothetical protein
MRKSLSQAINLAVKWKSIPDAWASEFEPKGTSI